jgi:hypothetical protein
MIFGVKFLPKEVGMVIRVLKQLPLPSQRTEYAAYLRALPRLVEEGEAGRWALIRGDLVHSVWDTCGDARQAGYLLFGVDSPFLAYQIDAADREALSSGVDGARLPEE